MLQCFLFAANLKKLENLHSEELREMPLVQLGRAANMKVELGRRGKSIPQPLPWKSPVLFQVLIFVLALSNIPLWGKKNPVEQEQGGGLRKPQGY